MKVHSNREKSVLGPEEWAEDTLSRWAAEARRSRSCQVRQGE